MCTESCGKALVRIRMAASPCLRICVGLVANIVLLHCFCLIPVTKDWDTIVLGTVKVWCWKQLRLTDTDSLNKWYYGLEIMRYVYKCSSSQIVTVFLPPPPGSCPAWAGNQRAYLLLPTSAAILWQYICGCVGSQTGHPRRSCFCLKSLPYPHHSAGAKRDAEAPVVQSKKITLSWSTSS